MLSIQSQHAGIVHERLARSIPLPTNGHGGQETSYTLELHSVEVSSNTGADAEEGEAVVRLILCSIHVRDYFED